MRYPKTIAVVLVGLAVAAQVFWTLSQTDERVPKPVRKIALSQPVPLEDFSLTRAPSGTFGKEDLLKKWTLLSFGFTHCPDVCPMTLDNLGAVVRKIAQLRAEAPQVVFVSVDPARDTPKTVARYASYFNEDFIGVTGRKPDLDALASRCGAFYRLGEKDETGFYTVNHSAEIFVIGPKARIVAKLTPPLEPAAAARQFVALQAYFAQRHRPKA